MSAENNRIPQKRLLFLALAVLIFAIDQLTKYPIRCCWPLYHSVPVFPGLAFTYVQNTGSLFGIFQGKSMALGFVSAIISTLIIGYAWKLRRGSGWLAYITLGVLLGGATGNMLDRLAFGFVVDFFDIQSGGKHLWPIFNVADIAVDAAIALFVLMAIVEPGRQLKAADQADKGQIDTPSEPDA